MDDRHLLATKRCVVMGVLQRSENVRNDRDDVLHWNRRSTLSCSLHDLAEVSTEHELHRKEVRLVITADLDDIDDVLVPQPAGDAGLMKEQLAEFLVVHDISTERLNRNCSLIASLAVQLSEMQVGHTAGGEPLDQDVRPDSTAMADPIIHDVRSMNACSLG